MSHRLAFLPLLLLMPGLIPAHQAMAQDHTVQASQPLSGTGVPLYINPLNIRDIQKALNKQGFNTGAVDGAWGAGTEKALRSFQTENNLVATGQPDIATLNKLKINIGLSGSQPGQKQVSTGKQAETSTPDKTSQTSQGDTSSSATTAATQEPSAGQASGSDSSAKTSTAADTDKSSTYTSGSSGGASK